MINIILFALAILYLICLSAFAIFLTHEIKELRKILPEAKQENPVQPVVPAREVTPEVDDKATNAERLYMEGIQSIFSYDVNTMKQYLKGDVEE